jgi:hypothetical protein
MDNQEMFRKRWEYFYPLKDFIWLVNVSPHYLVPFRFHDRIHHHVVFIINISMVVALRAGVTVLVAIIPDVCYQIIPLVGGVSKHSSLLPGPKRKERLLDIHFPRDTIRLWGTQP